MTGYLRETCRRCRRLGQGLMRVSHMRNTIRETKGSRIQHADYGTDAADYRDALRYHLERDHK